MSIEVIHHQHDFLGFGVVNVDQFANEVRPILTRAMLGDFDLPLSRQRFTGQENLTHASRFKDVIDPLGRPFCMGRLSRLSCSSCLALSSMQTWGKRAS